MEQKNMDPVMRKIINSIVLYQTATGKKNCDIRKINGRKMAKIKTKMKNEDFAFMKLQLQRQTKLFHKSYVSVVLLHIHLFQKTLSSAGHIVYSLEPAKNLGIFSTIVIVIDFNVCS